MLKGWRLLGNINGIDIYQQNKRYVGVVSSVSSISPNPPSPPSPPEPVLYGYYILSPKDILVETLAENEGKFIYSSKSLDIYFEVEEYNRFIYLPLNMSVYFEITKFGKYIISPTNINISIEEVSHDTEVPVAPETVIVPNLTYEVINNSNYIGE